MSDHPPELPPPANDNLDPEPELYRLLREAGSEELADLVRERAEELTPSAIRHALRNPYCTAEVVERIAAERRLLSAYEVRRDLARHPRTPEVLAHRFVPGLYWRDLMEIGLDTRLPPTVRRAAEQQVIARLPQMSLGEKMSLARRASLGVLGHLRHDPSPRVVDALLDNPRLTEGVLAPLAANPSTRPAVLELIASDRRWGVRYPVRLALVRNPSTPLDTAWRILGTLRKTDLKPVAADPRLPDALRRRARVLLGESV